MSNFWFNNIEILYSDGNYLDFWPSNFSSTSENLNAIFRLTIYISIALITYTKNFSWILIAGFGALLTLFLHNHNEVQDVDEFTLEINKKKECTKPTLGNPFMNVTFLDHLENPERPEACDINDPEIKEDVDNKFYNNLFRDTSDLFGKLNSQRQFYTMPATTIPNDRESFQNWLYKTEATCKENSDNCLRYEDVRYKRPVFPNPLQNPKTQENIEVKK
jgi:hypothetical protein